MSEEYYKTKKSVDEYIRLAKDVNGAELIEKFKKVLQPNARLLEIGSGPGTDWKILSKDYEVVGSDNSTLFINHLVVENPMAEFLELDATTLATDQKFDGIYSNKVLHHLRDEEIVNSIKRQYDILNSEGIVCHSFWKGEGSEIFKGLFVNYHTANSLRSFFEKQFEILLMEEFEEFESNDSILLIAKKK